MRANKIVGLYCAVSMLLLVHCAYLVVFTNSLVEGFLVLELVCAVGFQCLALYVWGFKK